MGTLREQMENDLVVRGISERTREAYIGAVKKLAKHYGRSPDRVRLMGHGHISSTQRYLHVAAKHLARTLWPLELLEGAPLRHR